MDFWLKMGVDGMRLDAVPYLYERDGTNGENLPETHTFLKELRRHVDARFSGRMLLAEANQWPEDSVAYFGNGDECHMAFHFPVMPRLFMAIRMEDRFPILDIMAQTPPIPENCQWALFLRNHDELTLEMVTDEERDYMYRVYAHDPVARINLGIRRRLAPLLGNHRRRIELMNGLLFSLPGAPVLYYGDEIGMGDNIFLGDRNGVRTPMQWSGDRNAGFSRTNPQRLYLPVIVDPEYHYESVNVEAQQNNPHSLLWWTKRLIALRKRFKAFSQGTIEFLQPDNRKVLAFLRRYGDEVILVVANLSRFAQYVELNLGEFHGQAPIEIFGQTEFPRIGDLPYLLTLGPHAFYWFTIELQRVLQVSGPAAGALEALPRLAVAGWSRSSAAWEDALLGHGRTELERALPAYLQGSRWFGGKARRIKSAQVADAIPLPAGESMAQLLLTRVEYTEGDPETYVLPLAFAAIEHAAHIAERRPEVLLARLPDEGDGKGDHVLYDALWDPGFNEALLDAIARRRRFKGLNGELVATPTPIFREAAGSGASLAPAVSGAEQSNSSILYGERLILKLFRRPSEGTNPDLEIGRFLTDRTAFRQVPLVAGSLEYRRDGAEPLTIGVLHGYVPHEGNAWQYTLDFLGSFFEQAAARPSGPTPRPEGSAGGGGVALVTFEGEPPALAEELLGPYLESVRLLGRRTADLHVALASASADASFAPEPFSALYQRSYYQSLRSLSGRTFQALRSHLKDLPEGTRPAAERVLAHEGRVLKRFQAILGRKLSGARTRVHGDYHLGQVLFTGKDFVIIDFEGEPARPVSERRIKRSPLRDVAGMLRSFHYATEAALLGLGGSGSVRPEDRRVLEPWARFWQSWSSAAYLNSYLATAAGASFLPDSREELSMLLEVHLLEKAVYELGYELNNRPDWAGVPLQGILQLIEAA
jgi:maltose alpha-D-glucosyltransferase/alpha-amylase